MNTMELTWQQFRANIKNRKYMHEGTQVSGWELPISKQERMYTEEKLKRSQQAAYINSGVKRHV
tara:strand:- start:1785 stop:1976 length:192 start_codon:yes stop_codon:yes gene_type:complete